MLKMAVQKISSGENLSFAETYDSVGEIIGGKAPDALIAAFLTSLRVKGEVPDEISGGARCLLDNARRINKQGVYCVDPVGTGGDGTGTFNISSMSALIAAAAGARIAKHGNRAVSSRCGSADFFESLGIDINLEPDQAQNCLDETGFTFLYAPVYHPAMKNAAPVRRQLGIRTIFNLLGPLANPAGAGGMLLGVCSAQLLAYMAEALHNLGLERAMVVHGHDGSDEISLTGPTDICEISDGRLQTYTVCPEDFGLARCSLADIAGGSSQDNVRILEQLLLGDTGPNRDVILFNTGAVLAISGLAENLEKGIDLAARTIDSGKAGQKLDQLRHFSPAGTRDGREDL